jgi:hypothetical protein
MLRHKAGFYETKPVDTTIRLADGSSIKCNLKGKVRVSVVDTKGHLRILELHDVLYVPSLSRSLFSVPAFLRHPRNQVTFLKNSIVFVLGGIVQASIPANNFANVTGAMATTIKSGNIVDAKSASDINLNETPFHYSPYTISTTNTDSNMLEITPKIISDNILVIPTTNIAHTIHRTNSDVCNNA